MELDYVVVNNEEEETDLVVPDIKRKLRCSYQDKYFTKWASDSSIHGVSHIFQGKSKIRGVLWGLVFLGAVAGCLYGIIDRIIYYSQRPTATTVSIEINENGIPFPAVTICNLSPVRLSYAQTNNITELLQYIFFTDIPVYENVSPDLQEDTCSGLLADVTDTDLQNMQLKDIYNEGGHDISSFIVSCIFGNSINHTDCTKFISPLLTSDGLCFTFNSLENKVPNDIIKYSGDRFGLRIFINISQREYISSSNGDVGVKVAVHDQHVVPESQSFGIAVPPGRHAFIGLHPEEYSTDPQISACAGSDTELEFFSGRSYSLSACKLNEYYKTSVDMCNCIDVVEPPSTGQYSNIRYCTLSDVCCLFNASIMNNANDCVPSCERSSYQSAVSYSQFPSNRFAAVVSSFVDVDVQELKDNVIALNVFYGSTHTTKSVTQFSYGISALFADIGGQLALFVGASLISAVEIVFLCYDEVKRMCLFGRKKSKKVIESIEMRKIRNKNAAEKDEKNQE